MEIGTQSCRCKELCVFVTFEDQSFLNCPLLNITLPWTLLNRSALLWFAHNLSRLRALFRRPAAAAAPRPIVSSLLNKSRAWVFTPTTDRAFLRREVVKASSWRPPWGSGPFWQCFACPKLGDTGRTQVAFKDTAIIFKIQPSHWIVVVVVDKQFGQLSKWYGLNNRYQSVRFSQCRHQCIFIN